MNVTKVWVNTKYQKGKLLGFADVVFDDCLTITGFKIFANDDGNGYSVAFPSKEGVDKEGKKTWFPLVRVDKESSVGQEFQRHVQDEVTRAYVSKAGDKPTPVKQQSYDNNNSGFNDGDGVPF